MTVNDAIAELRRYPGHLPVQTVLSRVVIPVDAWWPYSTIDLDETDARLVTDVECRGNHVLMIG